MSRMHKSGLIVLKYVLPTFPHHIISIHCVVEHQAIAMKMEIYCIMHTTVDCVN
jgi:hypothetical protein